MTVLYYCIVPYRYDIHRYAYPISQLVLVQYAATTYDEGARGSYSTRTSTSTGELSLRLCLLDPKVLSSPPLDTWSQTDRQTDTHRHTH